MMNQSTEVNILLLLLVGLQLVDARREEADLLFKSAISLFLNVEPFAHLVYAFGEKCGEIPVI